MTAVFQLYRRAIAAFLGGLLPLIASALPGVADTIDPTAINVASVVLGAFFAAVTADKIDGASVVDLARVVVDALDRITDDDNPQVAAGVADTLVGRVDGLAAVIKAIPAPSDGVAELASAGVVQAIGLRGAK